MEQTAITLGKVVLRRFIKGALGGAIASITALSLNAPATWADLSTALIALVFAGVVGFITGGLLAVEKWWNFTETAPKE